MAETRRPPNGPNKNVKRSQSLLMHMKPPFVVAKERSSSLKREQSLKEPNHFIPKSPGVLRSPIEMFREQLSLQRRSKKRSPVEDSNYERSSSPLLGFHSPALRGRRGMMHAKSCDMTPLRLKLHMQESCSSDDSWNVAANDNSSCQIAQLNSSPTSQRRKVWTLERNIDRLSPPVDTADSSTSTSRSQSPAQLDNYQLPLSSCPATPDLPLEISITEATPPLTSKQASLRFKMMHSMRAYQSTSALYTNSVTSTYERVPVLHELVRTERRYVANLDLLLNTLLPAMEDTVAARDLRLLFPCQLDLLLDWHKQMLVQLEERQDQNSNHHDTVGDIFRRMCSREGGNSDFFDMYSAYMNEFKVAMHTLAKYEQSSQTFRQEVRRCQQQLTECDGLPLSAFLLTPVQRLPRYELLLKDLLKHTPVEHKDNYYLEDAIKLLHEELMKLNASIKSCEQACSVTRIRNGRRGSIRRLGSRASRQIAKQLKKHLSTISVEDLSSAEDRPNSEMPRPISTHQKTHSVHEMRDRNLYTSVENLPVLEEQEKRIERTSSCINLAADYDKHPERKRYSQPVGLLEPLESLPGTPEPRSPLSLVPQSETEDSAVPNTSRASVYSNTSSTSGIGSGNSQVEELDSTLTLTPSSPHPPASPHPPSSPDPPASTSLDLTPTNHPSPTHTAVTAATPHRPIIVSRGGPSTTSSMSSLAHNRWKKRISWAGSLVMPRVMRKKKPSVPDAATTSKRTSRDISLPMDFRHIQHGFITTSTPKPVS